MLEQIGKNLLLTSAADIMIISIIKMKKSVPYISVVNHLNMYKHGFMHEYSLVLGRSSYRAGIST